MIALVFQILGVVILALLIRWILSYSTLTNHHNLIAFLSAVVMTPVLSIFIFSIWVFSVSWYPQQDFDPDAWHKDPENRYTMSQDLIESNQLLGKTPEEVMDLLGQQEWSEDQDELNYYLGFVPQFIGIDPDILSIEFDQGKVIFVSQRQT